MPGSRKSMCKGPDGEEKAGLTKIVGAGDFPGGPVVKNLPAMQGTWFQSLVGKLGSHMPWSS